MRVVFVLPFAGLAGGIRVAVVYADALLRRGHEVTVVSLPRRRATFREAMQALRRGSLLPLWRPAHGPSHLDGSGVDWKVLAHDGPIKDHDVPDGDVVVATWWETAEWVWRLSDRKGAKVYFCQGFECHPWLPRERVEATYRLDMLQICVSDWVRQQIRQVAPNAKQVVVPNAVDCAQFSAKERKKAAAPTCGFMYSQAEFKGCDVALAAVRRAKELLPDLRVVCFGAQRPDRRLPMPSWVEFVYRPAQSNIAEIYARCNCWLFTSRAEGFGLPILEAMACGTPVIGTPAGAACELLPAGGGVLVPVDDVDAIVEQIVRIEGMTREEWLEHSARAVEVARSYTWEDAVNLFEASLVEASGEGSVGGTKAV